VELPDRAVEDFPTPQEIRSLGRLSGFQFFGEGEHALYEFFRGITTEIQKIGFDSGGIGFEDEFAREMGQASSVGSGADELPANESEFVGEEEFSLKGRGLAGGGIGQKEDEENSSSQHEEGPDEFWSVG